MKSGSKKNTETYYQTVTNNQTNTKMKLKDLHKAAVIYEEITKTDKEIKMISDYADRICKVHNSMHLTIEIKSTEPTSNEQLVYGPNGEIVKMFFNQPMRKIDPKDILEIDLTDADVLRVLNVLLLKKKEEQYYLQLETRKI